MLSLAVDLILMSHFTLKWPKNDEWHVGVDGVRLVHLVFYVIRPFLNEKLDQIHIFHVISLNGF